MVEELLLEPKKPGGLRNITGRSKKIREYHRQVQKYHRQVKEYHRQVKEYHRQVSLRRHLAPPLAPSDRSTNPAENLNKTEKVTWEGKGWAGSVKTEISPQDRTQKAQI